MCSTGQTTSVSMYVWFYPGNSCCSGMLRASLGVTGGGGSEEEEEEEEVLQALTETA